MSVEYAPVCPASNWLEAQVHKWFAYWHGAGEPHQYPYHRCKGCFKLVTWNAIRQGGCSCDLGNKLVPAKLKVSEKARILFAPWTI